MPSKHLKIPRAALILRKDRDTVKKWVNNGLLPTIDVGGEKCLDANMIYEIKELMDKGKGMKKPYERMAILEAKLKRLERTVNALLGVHRVGSSTSISHLDDIDLYRLFKQAKDSLKVGNWDDLDIRKWSAVFLQISEVELSRLELLDKNPVPWRVLLDLCNAMVEFWRERYSDNPNYHELAYLLDKSRTNLRNSIIIYTMDHEESLDEALRGFFNLDPIERLKKIL